MAKYPRIIFAIDNGADLKVRARFERHLDELRAMNKLQHSVRLCVGSWENKLESSYEMSAADFAHHVNDTDHVRNQDAFLFIGSDGACVLLHQSGGELVRDVNLRHFVPASAAEAHAAVDGFTYYLDSHEYFIAQ